MGFAHVVVRIVEHATVLAVEDVATTVEAVVLVVFNEIAGQEGQLTRHDVKVE